MICPACQTAADRGWAKEHHCLFYDSQCTCQHKVPTEKSDSELREIAREAHDPIVSAG